MASFSEIQTAATDAACFNCVSEKSLVAMLVYQLWLEQHPGGTMTAADVQDLADASACVNNCLSQKQLLAAVVELLYTA